MLAFAAFTPHPLLAVPGIENDEASRIEQTKQSYTHLAEELYAAKPDIIIVITPHASVVSGVISINQRPMLSIDFSKYGNLTDRLQFANDTGFGYRIKESLETDNSVTLVDDETLDYGSAIPLHYLTAKLEKKTYRVVSIGTSAQPAGAHYDIGRVINQHINNTVDRIAVIASGDLAHGSRENPVTQYNPHAEAFNKTVHDAINRHDIESIVSFKEDAEKKINECSLRILATLYGIIDERALSVEILSAETVLGIGYLSAQFHIR